MSLVQAQKQNETNKNMALWLSKIIYFDRKGIQSSVDDSGTPMALNNNHVGNQDKDGRHRNYFPTIPRGTCNPIKA
jgi:hypothetical protein